MPARKHDIKVFVKHQDKVHTFLTHKNEYRSLMALIYDKIWVENFGACKGTGRCGTCQVHLLNGTSELLQREGNEQTTLDKMRVIKPNSRLSCLVLINEEIHNLQVEIVDDDDSGIY